jgi:hypothetical protein
MMPVINNAEKTGSKNCIKKYEYELILLIYLLTRFVFKNILDFAKYFTGQPVFGPSNAVNIAFGSIVVLIVCVYLSLLFGQLIRRNGKDFENASLILVALFLACPVTLPFLFSTDFISGTQMLYPFALFAFAVFLSNRQYFKWLIPLICMAYFIPAVHSAETSFIVLSKGAILYVPLILLLLFFHSVDKHKKSEITKEKSANKMKGRSGLNSLAQNDFHLFFSSLIVGIGSYFYALNKVIVGFGETPYSRPQNIDIYLLAGLVMSSPALLSAGTVIYRAIKTGFPLHVFLLFLSSQILLFPLFRNNYYGLWIPFALISVFLFVFAFIWQKNQTMLSAAHKLGDFFTKRKLLLFITLLVMASLSNTSVIYASSFLMKIFSRIPY